MPSATAIIIGAGVIGLSTAYHLARKGYGRVIVLDKGPIGDGSSSRAAGIITGLLWSETGVRARRKSLSLFRELSEELEGYRFQEVGCLNLFDQASWPEREALLPLYKRLDVPFEILDAAEMGRRWPALQPHPEYTGLFDPLGGYSEPHEYLPALAARVREFGVEIREQQPANEILVRHGRVAGVQTSAGILEGDAVVCTVHAWLPTVIEPLGLRLPVKTFVHQRYLTQPHPAAVQIPAVNANPLGGYVRPAYGNRILAGIETATRSEYRVESREFHMSALSAPPGLREAIQTSFSSLLPALALSGWERESVGLIAFSMDGEPVLGPVRQLPGFYIGAAFHSGGFAYNPVAGLLLAEFVTGGQPSIDVSAFSPDRFNAQDVEAYVAQTIPQSQAVSRRQ